MHWFPGHKEIEANELADQQAKQAAIEMSGSDVKVPLVWDKREAFQEMKNKTVEKWNKRFACAENESFIHEVFSEVGKRRCWGEKDRMTFSHFNQLIRGHSKQSKINKERHCLRVRYRTPRPPGYGSSTGPRATPVWTVSESSSL